MLEDKKSKSRRLDYWRNRDKRLSVHKEYRDRLRKEEPWIRKYWSIKQRCEDSRSPSYKSYGAKGIKFLLSKEDLKTLWFRDKAFLLKVPSVDRIDNSGNYEFSNCRFIEMSENNKRKRKVETQADKVKAYLQLHICATEEQIKDDLKIRSVSARVSQLRASGYRIISASGRLFWCE